MNLWESPWERKENHHKGGFEDNLLLMPGQGLAFDIIGSTGVNKFFSFIFVLHTGNLHSEKVDN